MRYAIAALASFALPSLIVPWTVVAGHFGLDLAGPATFVNWARAYPDQAWLVVAGMSCFVACAVLPLVIALLAEKRPRLSLIGFALLLVSYAAISIRFDYIPFVMAYSTLFNGADYLDVGAAVIGPVLRLTGLVAAVVALMRARCHVVSSRRSMYRR